MLLKIKNNSGMTHSYTIAIDETDGITCLNLLTIDGCEVLVLIVAEHSFLRTIR